MLLSVVAGCTFWHNFSTYFNTLYLAQHHLDQYEEHERAIVAPSANTAVAIQNHRWLDEEYELRQKALYEGHAPAVQPSFSRVLSSTKEVTNIHLDSAIILGSKILADKKGNKYVEDALFVVGKAQYYKNDFAGARRKFLELLYKFPETKYGAEVQVLLAHSMLADKKLDTAQVALASALAYAQKDGDKHALSEIHRANAELIYVKNSDSLAAVVDELHKAEDGLEGEDLAKLAFEEGATAYMNSQWADAERAFSTAIATSKDDWLIGEAHIDRAMALRRENKFDQARAELDLIINKAKFNASQGPARYELALNDEMADRAAVGNNLKSTEFRETYHPELVREYYWIDTTFHNTSMLMISHSHWREAEMYREMGLYDSASFIAAKLINTRDFTTPGMNEYVSARASSLANFAKWRAEMLKVDSQITRIEHRTSGHEDFDLKVKALEQVLGSRYSPAHPTPMSKEDSSNYTKALAALESKRPGGAPIIVHDTARTLDSLELLSSIAHYQLGRSYETFLEIPQARTEYRSALNYHFATEDSAVKVMRSQSLFAWLELESRDKHEAVVDSLLSELLTHYGQTIYAAQARQLFAAKIKRTPGETAYEDAYGVLRGQGLEKAEPALLAIVQKYPEEDVAPRALYAIGLTYEEATRYDSAVVYYKQILKDYPFSAYAAALHPRLAEATSGLPHAPPPVLDPLLHSDTVRGMPVAPNGIRPSQPRRPPGNPQRPLPGLAPPLPHRPPTTPRGRFMPDTSRVR